MSDIVLDDGTVELLEQVRQRPGVATATEASKIALRNEVEALLRARAEGREPAASVAAGEQPNEGFGRSAGANAVSR